MQLDSNVSADGYSAQEVLELAKMAGILVWRKSEWHVDHHIHVEDGMDGDLAALVQLCQLVRDKERARAANICHSMVDVQYPATDLAERILSKK